MPSALITGGTSGIGRATAELLHETGYQVMVTGRNPETIERARRELPAEIVVVRADARSIPDTERVADEVRARFGTLTALFLNAGVSRHFPVEAVDESTYDELFATNTKSAFFTLQKTLPLMTGGGSVIFTVGIGATRGGAGGSVTAGSRGALLAMVPSLAVELAPRGIRVNAVSPGAIDTPIWAKSGSTAEQLALINQSLSARIPAGRMGTAHELARTVAFLASDAAAYVTGQNLIVDGGFGIA